MRESVEYHLISRGPQGDRDVKEPDEGVALAGGGVFGGGNHYVRRACPVTGTT
jgi:hypothetical protein